MTKKRPGNDQAFVRSGSKGWDLGLLHDEVYHRRYAPTSIGVNR